MSESVAAPPPLIPTNASQFVREAKPPPVPIPAPAAKVETPPIEAKPPPEPAKENALAEQFATLTKKEKALLAERQKLQQDAKDIDDRRASMSKDLEEAAQLKKWKSSINTDTRAALEGLLGEDWFRIASEVALEKRTPTDLRVAALQDEIAELRAERGKDKEEMTNAQKTALERDAAAEMNKFRASTKEYVKAAGVKYKLTNKLEGGLDYVTQVIEEHWARQKDLPDEDKKVLSADEAADHVEKWLEKQARLAAETLGLTPAAAHAEDANAAPPDGEAPGAKSITGSMNGTSASAPASKVRTEEERQKAAFAAYDAAMARRKTKTV